MSKIDRFERFHPLTRQEWREWLSENHDKTAGIWFVYFKKATGKPRVSYDEAVEEALCAGWIDSLPRKMDDARSSLLFTPGKPKSVWSKLNKARIEKLINANLMTEFGLEKIKAAKADGSWNALNDSDDLKIPADLAQKFAVEKEAEKNFNAFSASIKRTILAWVNSAKRAQTRNARIAKTVEMARRNKRANFDTD